jgi:hypothetical protein
MTIGTGIAIYSAIGLSFAIAAGVYLRGPWTLKRAAAGVAIALLWPLIPSACVAMMAVVLLDE